MPQPVQWAGKAKSDAVEYLHAEIVQAIADRQSLENQWFRYLDLYRAPASQPLKRFPFEGAHNYMLPAMAIDTDTLVATFMQSLHAASNIWSIEALNERWVNAAKPMQDFLEVVDHRLLKMFSVNDRAILEMVKLGTGIYKTGWLYESRPIQTYTPQGKRIKGQKVVTQPFVDHVRLTDFLLPSYSFAIQPDEQGGAPWVAERIRLSPWQFRNLATSKGEFLPQIDPEDVNAILQFEEKAVTDYQQVVNRQTYQPRATQWGTSNTAAEPAPGLGTGAASPTVRQIELWEVHARIPTSGNELNDVILLYHLGTRKILRPVYADWLSGERPYDAIRYVRAEGFYGIGVGEQKEMFQMVNSDLMNFALDNLVLGNSTMLAARAGANIAAGEPIYPGKILLTDGEPSKEVMGIQLGTNNANAQAAFQIFSALGEKRTGVSDIQLGNIQDLPGRTPATTMVSMLQEGKKRPDLTIKRMRYEGLSNVGLKTLQGLQQMLAQPSANADGWLEWTIDLLGLPEGAAVAEKLISPSENVAFGLGVSLTATSGSANKEVERQGLTALLQLTTGVAQQVIQLQTLAIQSAGTPIAQTAILAANGIIELTKRLMEQYDVRNIEDIIPPATAVAAPGPALAPPPAGGDGSGGGAPAGAPAEPGMGNMGGAAGPGMGAGGGAPAGGPPPR